MSQKDMHGGMMGSNDKMMMSGSKMASHPHIYLVSADATAIIDPANWELLVIASGLAPGRKLLLQDNHYRDQFGRLWSESQATENGSALAGVYVSNPMSFANEMMIGLGQNVLNTVGLTPDGKFAVVPVSTANQLNVYDTSTYQQVATMPMGMFPNDMMTSSDGKYCYIPERDSDQLTLVDPKTWKVASKIPIGDGSAPFMVTVSPSNKFASVQCAGYHGGKYNLASGPPAMPTGKGVTHKYVDLKSESVAKSIPLDFEAIWDEYTPDGKYDFIFGPGTPKTVVVDTASMEVVKTIPLASELTGSGYITPDPNGKYVYASTRTGLQVIDTGSLEVMATVPTNGVVGTPYVSM